MRKSRVGFSVCRPNEEFAGKWVIQQSGTYSPWACIGYYNKVARVMRCAKVFLYSDGYRWRMDVRDDYNCPPYFNCELRVGVSHPGAVVVFSVGHTNGRMPCMTCEYRLFNEARHCQYASYWLRF